MPQLLIIILYKHVVKILLSAETVGLCYRHFMNNKCPWNHVFHVGQCGQCHLTSLSLSADQTPGLASVYIIDIYPSFNNSYNCMKMKSGVTASLREPCF